MKTPHNPSVLSIAARVEDLDDATLKTAHALLDSRRAQDFADWLDQALLTLEARFDQLSSPVSRRLALGR